MEMAPSGLRAYNLGRNELNGIVERPTIPPKLQAVLIRMRIGT